MRRRLVLPLVLAAAAAWPAAAHATDINVCSSCAHTTIQSAVNDATGADRVIVAAGAYTEAVSIPAGKDGLTIDGAEAGQKAEGQGATPRAGGETTLGGTTGLTPAFFVSSSNVTID